MNRRGDCFRTAISCILEIPRDDVPHVFHDGCDPRVAVDRMAKWLAQRGLVQFEIAFDGREMTLEQVLAPINCAIGGLPEYLLHGRSANGTNHTVVCRGNKIAWDPSIDESGIVGPCDDGHWWITALAVTRPTGNLFTKAERNSQLETGVQTA